MLDVHLYRLVVEKEFERFFGDIKNRIPNELLQKTLSYKFKKDQQRTLIGELIVRNYYQKHWHIAHPEFQLNEHGKPYLKNQQEHFFNISHSGDYIVVVFSRKEVGIDVEMIGKDRRHIATRFFTSEEIAYMNELPSAQLQIQYFYQLWTLKESYMKAIGGGMTMSLSTFSFQKREEEFSLLYSKYDTDWHFKSTQLDDTAFLSVCSKSSEKLHFTPIDLKSLQ